ncbi:GtrA family protein [Paenibacillus sp. N3.4]|nr:GtrA family protein [Paenibacillus sp. N3.4]
MMAQSRFIKFLFVGGINTLFGYCLFALFIYLNFHYTFAALLSTIIGIFFNFKTTGTIVFKNRDNSLLKKFFGVYALIYLLNISSMYFINILFHNQYISGAITILPLAILSFYLNNKYVFNKKVSSSRN